MSGTTATLARQLAGTLARRGVRHAFGMPGGVLLTLIDAFREVGIDFVLVRHEGAAGFMADVTSQLTGAPGVCVGTLGPGVTNLVSPIAGAHLERSPVLAITGQVRTDILDSYTHQILDHAVLFETVTRHSVMLTAANPAEQVKAALAAMEGSLPGPALIDVPAELWSVETPPMDANPVPDCPPIAEADLEVALALSQGAKRPVIAVGVLGLNARVHASLTKLAHHLRAPVIATYRAKGAIDENDPWCAGAFGLSPVVDRHQQALLARADVLIAVGLDPVELRPQWLPGWPAELPMVSVGASADIPHPIAASLGNDVGGGLEALCSRLAGGASLWTEADVEVHKTAWSTPFVGGPSNGPAATIEAVQRGMGPDAICSMDVGSHRITASHVWRCTAPFQQVQSNGFSSMGTGLPGAIAAKLCHPDRPVVALTGDMGLWMVLGELGVVQERRLDLVVVYLADRSLSLIEIKQERTPLPNHGVRFENPEVVSLAAAFGGTGHRVEGATAVEASVREARESGGLHIIEAIIDPASYRRQM
jgi:acetolactate synthase-1/2/3 large subunit